jgi:hypothetical protein
MFYVTELPVRTAQSKSPLSSQCLDREKGKETIQYSEVGKEYKRE